MTYIAFESQDGFLKTFFGQKLKTFSKNGSILQGIRGNFGGSNRKNGAFQNFRTLESGHFEILARDQFLN